MKWCIAALVALAALVKAVDEGFKLLEQPAVSSPPWGDR